MAKALSPPREFGFLLSDVARNLRKTVDHEAKALGMTRAQWSVLVRLQRQQGLQQAELASALDLAPITLARLVDHLEDMKFVERRPDPDDRRAYRLFLTATAGPVLTKLSRIGERIMKHALKGIDEEQVSLLTSHLSHMHTNLKSYQKSRDKVEHNHD